MCLTKSLTEQTAVAPSAGVAAVPKAVLFVQTGLPDVAVHLSPVDPHTHCPDTHRLASVSSVQSESEKHLKLKKRVRLFLRKSQLLMIFFNDNFRFRATSHLIF